MWNQLRHHTLYREELKLVYSGCPDIHKLSGCSVLVTGATGLIGSAVIDLLLFCNEIFEKPVRIYATSRNKDKLQKRFGQPSDTLVYLEYDANDRWNFDKHVDYIIHAASNAQPELYVSQPVETMLSNFCGLQNLLELARSKAVNRVLYVSSSEVYGQKQDIAAFQEDDYGYVDILNLRSSYAMSKRASETLCKAYLHEYGVDTVMVRPGHIYGPTAPASDNRVAALFTRKAARGEELVLKSTGTQLRSYCHCLDCASAILTVLLKGEPGEPYNISNNRSIITIKEMAELISKIGNVPFKIDCPTREDLRIFNPMDNSSLNSTKLEELGWHGCIDAEIGFAHYVKIQLALEEKKVGV